MRVISEEIFIIGRKKLKENTKKTLHEMRSALNNNTKTPWKFWSLTWSLLQMKRKFKLNRTGFHPQTLSRFSFSFPYSILFRSFVTLLSNFSPSSSLLSSQTHSCVFLTDYISTLHFFFLSSLQTQHRQGSSSRFFFTFTCS